MERVIVFHNLYLNASDYLTVLIRLVAKKVRNLCHGGCLMFFNHCCVIRLLYMYKYLVFLASQK